jgi:hypothetical protein
MEMAPARLSAMCMHLIFEFDRYSNKASVTDAALGDYMPSELADVAHRAPQHRYLHTTVVIKMDMHRRHRQIMVHRSCDAIRFENLGESGFPPDAGFKPDLAQTADERVRKGQVALSGRRLHPTAPLVQAGGAGAHLRTPRWRKGIRIPGPSAPPISPARSGGDLPHPGGAASDLDPANVCECQGFKLPVLAGGPLTQRPRTMIVVNSNKSV